MDEQEAWLLRIRQQVAADAVDWRKVLALGAAVDAAGWRLLGDQLAEQGDWLAAAACFRCSLARQPEVAEVWHNLGVVVGRGGDGVAAEACYRQAVTLAPEQSLFRRHWGNALAALGRLAEGAQAIQAGLAANPRDPLAWNSLATILFDLGQVDGAIHGLRQALALQPDYPEAINNLGAALKEAGFLDEALAVLRRGLARIPEQPAIWDNLGNLLKNLGLAREAAMAYGQALALAPDRAESHDNLRRLQLYAPPADPSAGRAAQAQWELGAQDGAGFFSAPAKPGATIKKKLRIGYLSSDLRDHPVGRNLWPLVSRHDPSQFRLHAYADVANPDGMTQKFRECIPVWREIGNLSDSQVADLIRGDEIDILVILAGHFDRNRPLVAAYGAAPIQVSLHDPVTSGLQSMDYLIADRHLAPRRGGEWFAERVVRLPCFYLNQPPESAPEPGEPPLLRQGYPTFGSFNNPAKLSDDLLALWAEVLRDIPEAVLLFHYKNWFASQVLTDRIRRILANGGIDPGRLRFLAFQPSRAERLALWRGVDIALDTHPFSGSTTTFDALWMGVPVVTLAGATMVARWTGAMLQALGHPEWIGADHLSYREICRGLAADPAGLTALRQGLRARVAASPLCDASGRVRQVERLYRAMWRRWCGEET